MASQQLLTLSPILPDAVTKPKTPEDLPMKPDQQLLSLLSTIMQRLTILEKNLQFQNEELEQEHIERHNKLQLINQDISALYSDYATHLSEQDDLAQLEQKIKVEIDYNLVRILENKLKMDQEVYVMRKKLYERTVRMRELQVTVYNFKNENKDLREKVAVLEKQTEDKDKEIRRMQDIVYNVNSLGINPGYGASSKLSVPVYKGYESYLGNQQEKHIKQQKYYLENQTLKFGRKQHEHLKDGIWQVQNGQTLSGSVSHSLLQNAGKLLVQPQKMGLNDILPDSWINHKFGSNKIESKQSSELGTERSASNPGSVKSVSIQDGYSDYYKYQ